MTTANIIIQKFIDNFNYTKKSSGKKKRVSDGYFNHYFFNNKLTSMLEGAAQRIHKNLKYVIRSELSEEKKFSEFILEVKKARETAFDLRVEYGKKDSQYKPAGYDWILCKDVYSIPLKPGKFEAEMLKGLNAIKDDVPDCHKKAINELITKLSTYDDTRRHYEHYYVRNPSYQEKQPHDRGRRRNRR